MPVLINHSRDPDTGLLGNVIHVAIRDIAARERLSHDCAMEQSDKDAFDCRSGRPRSRGKVTGDDCKLPELQGCCGDCFSVYPGRKIEESEP